MRAYHRATKHSFERYAVGPFELDWSSQPDPFRRYAGAELAYLDRDEPSIKATRTPTVARRAFDRAALSQLLFDAFAISAWKQFGEARWSLRCNPSSGNLHPTEVHLIAPSIEALAPEPFAAHYAADLHALELRARVPLELWGQIARDLGEPALVIGFTTIPWRESWKYGERAFRYCALDLGHALGSLAASAALLGWRIRVLDHLASDDVATLLGLVAPKDADAELPSVLVAIEPAREPSSSIDDAALERFRALDWRGAPNELSTSHVDWDAVDRVAEATAKPRTALFASAEPIALESSSPSRYVLRSRRSAVRFDARTSMSSDSFFALLRSVLIGGAHGAFHNAPWRSRVDLALFVHRVDGLEPGIYLAFRDAARVEVWREFVALGASRARPIDVAAGSSLVPLRLGDVRALARSLCCHQEIASDGCFAVAMLADFEPTLDREGPSSYPRLFWECGWIGQSLYLEIESLGLRGTGIGCFFDDPTHAALGLRGERFQSLYHFAVGAPVDDPRITELPAYAPLSVETGG